MAHDMINNRRLLVPIAIFATLSLYLSRASWHPIILGTKSLRTRLSSLYPHNPQADLPKYIWQTWKYSPDHEEFPAELRDYASSWTEKNPNFQQYILTDAAAATLINQLFADLSEVREAYAALPEPVLKADFFRYLLLLAYGGIYSDIDTAALKPFDSWVPTELEPYGLVVGIEADPDRPDWHDWYARRIQFCQWTIVGKPGHPVLVDVVTSIAEETLKRKTEGTLNMNMSDVNTVLEFTGPGVWTDALFRYWNDASVAGSPSRNVSWERFANLKQPAKEADVVVLPITSFSPGIGHMGAGSATDPMAYVSHGFSGSWKPEEP